MANSDKNIRIETNKGKSGYPNIAFIGSTNDPINLYVLDDNTLSFEGSTGQLFSVSNSVTSGTIFSVNDISGIPSLRVDADGTVGIAEFSGNVGVGTVNPLYKLDVNGDINAGSGKTLRIGGVRVLDSTTLGSTIVNSSLTGFGTVTSGTWNGTPIAVLYGGTGATTAADARTNLSAATAGTNSDITVLNAVQRMLVTIPSATGIGITVRGATSQTGNLQQWQNSSASNLSWINSSGTFSFGASFTHADGRTPGVSVQAPNAAGIVARGFNSDAFPAIEVQNNPGGLSVGLYPSGLVYGGVLQAYSSTASTSSTTGVLLVAGGAGIAKTSYFGQSVVIQGTTASGSTTTGALVVTGGVGIGGTLNVNTANVVTDFNHTPNNTTIGGASGWVASTASTFISPGTFRYLNNKYIGIGGTYVYYSDDMINWSSVMVPNLDPARPIANITYGEGKYVFVQYYTANAGYSTNLTNWTNVAIQYQTWNDVIYGNGRFVATVGGDLAAYSLDGTSWTSVTDSIALGFNTSLKFLNGYFYVTNANAISRSIDGIIWQVCNTPAVPYGLAYGNGLYVGGIYNSGTIVYSYDGLNFSSYSGSSFVHNGSFFYNGVYYLTTQNNNVIRYSTDGFNWTNSTGFPGAVFNLQYIKGFLYAGSGNTVWVTNATPGRFEVNPLRTGTLDDVEIGRLSPNNANFIDVSVNNNLNVSSQYSSTSPLNGALTVAGGVGIAKTSFFGQSVVIQGATASGSTTTGALSVSGGVGIGGSLNVFGTIDVSNNIEILAQKEVRFFNSGNTFYTGLKSGSSSANVTFTLPIADGSANQVLYTNGSAALGWTTLPAAITSLNGLTAATQTFATGTSGSDFNISSSTSTHTFNIPYAGAASTGLVTTQTQTIAGAKTFSGNTIISSSTGSTNTATGALVVTGGVGIGSSVNIGGKVGINTGVYTGAFNITTPSASTPGLVVQGSTSQTADYLQILSSTGTTSFLLNSSYQFAWPNIGTLKVYGASYSAQGRLQIDGCLSVATGPFLINTGGGEASMTSSALTFAGSIGLGTYSTNTLSTNNPFRVQPTDTSVIPIVINAQNASWTSGNLFLIQNNGSSVFSVDYAGNTNIFSTVGSASTTSGALIVRGGVGIGGSVNAGGVSRFTSATASTSSSSGALIVTGGIGVGQTSYFASDEYVQGRLYLNQATLGVAGTTVNPSIAFIGQTNNPITLSILSDNSLSFEGSSGQLFSINNNLTSGTIFSVSDISGLPILRANANGTLSMAEFGTNVGIGTSLPNYKLHVMGDVNIGTGYTYRINGTKVVDAVSLGSAVVSSSLTSVGTLNSGVWNATTIGSIYGGTGQTTYTDGQLLIGSSTGGTLIKSTLTQGSGILITTSAGSITISTSGSGITSLNGLSAAVQTFATGTSGTDFNISSSTSTHTFNIPYAGAASTGLITTGAQTIAGAKTFSGNTIISSSTASTSTATGALVVTGGVGISGRLNVGTATTAFTPTDVIASFARNVAFFDNLKYASVAIQNTSSAEYSGVQLSLRDNLAAEGTITFWNSNPNNAGFSNGLEIAGPADIFYRAGPSSSFRHGFTGGYGVNIEQVTVSTASTNGALKVNGGAGIAKTSYFGQSVFIQGTTASGSTTTGALVVTGGVGIGGSLWTSSSNLSSISGVTLNNGTITGTLSGTATTATNQSTTTLSGTMFLYGQAASTGVATGTTAFVGSGLSFVSSTGTLTAAFYNGSGIQLSGIVTSLASSTGISVNSSTGAVTVTNTGVISLTGTANQVLVNGASGVATSSNITLTTPQSIGTASSPSFADVTLTTGANSTLAAVGSAPTSIVNKQYVDNLAAGLDIHESMRVLQASAIGASYVQTQTAGAAATSSYLISTTQVALPAIDGVTISATGTTQRILIAGGFTGSATIGGTAAFTPGNSFIANGSYYVAALGGAGTSNWILVRTPDADDNVELTGGTFTFIEEGTSYADSGWVCSNDTLNQGSIQFGSTAISFTQFTGGGALTVGQGLTKVGNNISANIKISAIGSASGIGYTQFNLGGTSGGGTADTGYYPTFAVRTSGAAAGSAILTLNTDGFSLVGSTNSNRTITVTGSDITLTGGGNTLTLTGSISLPAPTQNGIAYGSSSTALAFMTAAGSGSSVLTQISGSAPVYLGQSQLVVGGATTAALVNTDASTATRYLVGTVLNTASGSTQLSTGSGITIGDNRLTSGGIAVTNTTASTSTTTGALVVTGGVGIAKTSYFGQDVKIQGSTASTNQTTGALTVTGGVGISGRLNVGTKSGYIDTLGTLIAGFAGSADSSSAYVKIENTSPDFFSHTSLFLLNDLAEAATIYYFNSNSFDFSKALFIENNYGDLTLNVGTGKTVKIKTSESNTTLSLDSTKVSIAQTTVSTSSTTGALTLVGGAGIAKTSYFGQSVVIQGSTASGSTTTGALVVSGGVGIGGSLNVFGTIDVADNIEVLSQKEVRFFNSANTFYTGLRSGSSSANVTFTLPVADGSANQVLYTNGSAGLAWTTLPSAITTLNGLTASTQTFATGTSGTDFNISSSTSTHTFNIPDASGSNRGLVTTGAQTIAGAKTFSGNTIVSSSTASTSTATGALVVSGGVGIGGTVNINGRLNSGSLAAPVLETLYLTSGEVLSLGTYYYVVTAVDFDGNESLPSNQLTAIVNIPTTRTVSITFSNVAGAREYRIYRSTTSGVFTNSFIRTTKNRTFVKDPGYPTLTGSPPTETRASVNKISYDTTSVGFYVTGNILHGLNIPTGSLSVRSSNATAQATVEIGGDVVISRPLRTLYTLPGFIAGTLTTGTTYHYRYSLVDMRGKESLASDPMSTVASALGSVYIEIGGEAVDYQLFKIYRSTDINSWTNTLIFDGIGTATGFFIHDINYPSKNSSPILDSSSYSNAYISSSDLSTSDVSTLSSLALAAGQSNFYKVNNVPVLAASASTAAGTLTTNTTYYYRAAFVDNLGGLTRSGPEIAINTGSGTAISLSVDVGQNQGVFIYRTTTPNFSNSNGVRLFTTGTVIDDGSLSSTSRPSFDALNSYQWSLGNVGNLLPSSLTIAPPSNGFGLGIASRSPSITTIADGSIAGTLTTGTKYYYRIVGLDAFGQSTSSFQIVNYIAPATGSIFLQFGSSRMGFSSFNVYRSTNTNSFTNTLIGNFRNNYFTDVGFATTSGSPRLGANLAKDIYLKGVNDDNINTGFGVISNGFYTRANVPVINSGYGVGPNSGTLTTNTNYYYKIRVHFWANNTVGEVSDPFKVNTGSNTAVYLQWTPIEGAQHYTLYRSTNPRIFTNAIIINGIKDNYVYDFNHSVATETPTANYNGSNTAIGDTYGSRLSSLLIMGDNQKLRSLFDAPKFSTYPTSATGGTLANNTVFFYTVVARGYTGETSLASSEIRVDTGSNNAVSLNWLNVNGATGYDVYRSTTINSWTNTLIASNVQSTSFVDINYSVTTGTPNRLNAYGVGYAESLFENNYNILGRSIFGSVNNVDSAYQNFTVRINGNIFRNSSASTLQVGTGFTNGYTFSGSSNGTELAIASGTGFTGSLFDAHSNGSSRFSINFDGSTSIGSSTASTNTTTGALTVTGGAGIAKTSYFGQDVKILGSTASTSPTTGALVVTGGVGISGRLYIGQPIDFPTTEIGIGGSNCQITLKNTYNGPDTKSSGLTIVNNADIYASFVLDQSYSSNPNRLSIINDGNIYYATYGTNTTHTFESPLDVELTIGGTGVSVLRSTASTSTTTGALTVTGGAGIAKTSYFGQSVVIQGTTGSASTTTGALTVTGGVGIGGSLNVFGTIDVADNIEVLSQKEVRFFNSANTFYTGLRAGSSAANVTFTLPIADGSANQVLYTNGSAALGWTSIASAITSLNGLTAATQTFATGTSGTDFNISSSTSTHTFNIPDASGSNRGLVTTGAQTIAGAKTFSGNTIVSSSTASTSPTTGALTVSGGVGISGRLSVGPIASVNDPGMLAGFATSFNGGALVMITNAYPTGQAGLRLRNSSNHDAQITYYASSSGSLSELLYISNDYGNIYLNAGAGKTILLYTGSPNTNFRIDPTSVSIAQTTASTSSTTGGLIVAGGAGIAKTSYFGQDVKIQGSTASTTPTTGALTVAGGVGISGKLIVGTATTGDFESMATFSGTSTASNLVIKNYAGSILSTTGLYLLDHLENRGSISLYSANWIDQRKYALELYTGLGDIRFLTDASNKSHIFEGGIGVTILQTTVSTSTSTGALIVAGGAGIAKTSYFGQSVVIQGSTASTSPTTGALTVTGGVGIGGSLWTSTSNLASVSGVTLNNGTITGTLSGTATSAQVLATTTDTTSTLYLLGSRSSTGFAGTAVYVDTNISFSGSTITASLTGTATTATTARNVSVGSAAGSVDTQYFIGTPFAAAAGIALSQISVLFSYEPSTETLFGENADFISIRTDYFSGVAVTATNFYGPLTGNVTGTASIASSSVNSATTTDTTSTLYLLGSRSSTGFAGTALYVDSSISILGSQITAGVWGGTAISAVNGGTGQNTYVIGDILYASSTSALTRLAAGTASSVLTSNGAGTAPSWKAISDSGTVTSGTAGSIAYYTGTGTTVGGSPGFTYTTSGTASTINVFGGSAIGTTIFTVQATSATSVRVGIGTNLPQYELEIVGELSATNKSFVIDHPTKPGKKLRYGSLEGPENGVYVRGELKDSNIIETPDHWEGLVHPDSFTVTLTPIGRFSYLYVEKIEDYKVFIADAYMNPIHCYYTVWAERKDIPKLITEY